MSFAQGCPVPWRVFVTRALPHTERQACAASPEFTAVATAPPIAGSYSKWRESSSIAVPTASACYLDGRVRHGRQPARDRRPGGRRPAAVRRARPLLGDAERRDLQLRRAPSRARAARPPVRDASRHRGDRSGVRGVGRRLPRPAERRLRVRDLGRETRELFLARDRFGVRPLFLAECGGTSASPPRRRRCCATRPRVASSTRSGSRTRSSPGRRSPDRSAFAGIRELPPAHYVVIGPDGLEPATRWWDIDFAPVEAATRTSCVDESMSCSPIRSGSGCART